MALHSSTTFSEEKKSDEEGVCSRTGTGGTKVGGVVGPFSE